MPWSIYAYIPIIWLFLIIFHGLMRAAYDVKLDYIKWYIVPLKVDEVHFDAVTLTEEYLVSDLARKVAKHDIMLNRWQSIRQKLGDRAKLYITGTSEHDSELRYTKITGRLFIGKERT